MSRFRKKMARVHFSKNLLKRPKYEEKNSLSPHVFTPAGGLGCLLLAASLLACHVPGAMALFVINDFKKNTDEGTNGVHNAQHASADGATSCYYNE
jgi:hypothetical protein